MRASIKIKKLYNDFTNHEKLVILSDVTELEALKERYEYAIDGSNDGLWDWNLENDTIYFSPRWKAMIGYEESELGNSLSIWESRVHPDDLQEAEDAITKNIEGKTQKFKVFDPQSKLVKGVVRIFDFGGGHYEQLVSPLALITKATKLIPLGHIFL